MTATQPSTGREVADIRPRVAPLSPAAVIDTEASTHVGGRRQSVSGGTGMEWIGDKASLWLPILLGLATAIVGRAVLSTGRLRRDLAADLQLLKDLPPRARSFGYLNRSVHGRVVRLVAQVRYPTFAATDLVGLVVVLVCAAANATIALSVITDRTASLTGGGQTGLLPVALPLMYGAVSVGAWAVCFASWSRRAAQRYLFMRDHLARDELTDLRVLSQALVVALAVSSFALVLAPALVAAAAAVYRLTLLPLLIFLGLVGAVVFVAMVAMARFVVRSPFALLVGPVPLGRFRWTTQAERNRRAHHRLARITHDSGNNR